MAPPSIAGAVAGGYLAGTLPDTLLLLVIAAVLVQAGDRPAAPAGQAEARARGGRRRGLDVRAAAVSGAVIGVLGGVVGLILGSLRMPALLRWVGEGPQKAVGTNVTVGVFVGVAGSLAHLPNAAPDLDVIVVGGAASIPGALLGSRLTGRLSDGDLVRAIGVVVLVAAAACLVQAVT